MTYDNFKTMIKMKTTMESNGHEKSICQIKIRRIDWPYPNSRFFHYVLNGIAVLGIITLLYLSSLSFYKNCRLIKNILF